MKALWLTPLLFACSTTVVNERDEGDGGAADSELGAQADGAAGEPGDPDAEGTAEADGEAPGHAGSAGEAGGGAAGSGGSAGGAGSSGEAGAPSTDGGVEPDGDLPVDGGSDAAQDAPDADACPSRQLCEPFVGGNCNGVDDYNAHTGLYGKQCCFDACECGNDWGAGCERRYYCLSNPEQPNCLG